MPIPKSTRYDQLKRKVTKKSLPSVENIEKEHIYCNEGFEENDSSGNDFKLTTKQKQMIPEVMFTKLSRKQAMLPLYYIMPMTLLM